MITAKSSKRPRLVIEVEPEDSVAADEATRRWMVYDERYETWMLAVPAHVRRAAKAPIDDHCLANVRPVT